jgi:hypothetical protein
MKFGANAETSLVRYGFNESGGHNDTGARLHATIAFG